MNKITLPIILLFLLILQSCTSNKNILYLQDLDEYSNSTIIYATTKIQPNDILKIDISDINPIVAAPFNINTGSSVQNSVEMMKLSGYLVNPQGNIMMPVLNEVNIGGLTPSDVEKKIKNILIKEGYLVNPTVQARVINNKFTVIGEVKTPGVIPFTEESISLIDALAKAGDLTYEGVRTDVKLIREEDGKRLVYHVDLTTANWMSNPTYRIRQNDVIMVTPNNQKVKNTGILKDPIQTLGVLATLLTLYYLIRTR
ncbi:polysaccharide biosynthesis/export family protein [Flavobacterium cellulosilyticum]|uniref:Polysaccharide export protein n=1 Tax=Flavobacterium cellulosilyticum TaxID=2541731 RepID=A0A4R5C7I5_9FLAO|nr:polysaccharide biosynthesis/export family protein [Flavobacterium cellulosilyticum]TDD94689.1 polysaccharide export protein [Flavobacterium cellulosilyticum]